jgi:hypothetical protein
MTTGRMIDYEALSQDAMRGVVRTVLSQTAKSGLPGDHHFYISFDTQAPSVVLSRRLQEKYPEEMTIVLQHRFWDLVVSEDRFEVKLTFDGIPERLVVPFAAIKVFFDPSVRFGLQFEAPEPAPEAAQGAQSHRGSAISSAATDLPAGSSPPTPLRVPARSSTERKPRPVKKPRIEKPSEPAGAALPGPSPQRTAESKSPGASPAGAAVVPLTPAHPASGARVVSIDAFRKK